MFERIRKALSQFRQPTSAGGGQFPTWDDTFLSALRGGGRSLADMRRSIGDGFDSSVVMAPVQWIARTFPEAPLVVSKLGGAKPEPLPTHPLAELIRNPNPWYDGEVLWTATIVSYAITGNAYWLKVRDKTTGIITDSLVWVPPWTMTPRRAPERPGDFVSWYDYAAQGQTVKVMPEDVVHFRFGLNPRNVMLGLSPLDAALREVYSDDEASRLVGTVLGNMGVPGLVLSPRNETLGIGDQAAQAIKEKLVEKTTGARRGEPLVLSGAMRVDRVSWSPSELDLGNVRDVSEERVCALLGLPAAVVGFGTGLETTKVGATMREMVGLAWRGCLVPMQRTLGAQLGRSLLPDFEDDPRGFAVGFNHSGVYGLEEDVEARHMRLTRELGAGAITVAEYREQLGYEVKPENQVYLVPIGSIPEPAGQVPVRPQITDPQNGNGVPKGRRLVDRDGKSLEDKRARATVAQQRLLVRMTRAGQRLERAWTPDLEKFFGELGAAAAAAAQQVLGGKNGKRGGRKAIEDEVDAEEMMMLFGDYARAAKDALGKLYGAQYLRVFEETVSGVVDTLGLAVNLPDTVARQIVATGGRRAGLVDLDGQTRERLFSALTEGRSLGEGADALVRRIRDEIPAGPWKDAKTRARVIARTETLHAQRASALEAYQHAEGVTQVMLFDNRTGFDDEDCAARDGQVVSFDEAQAAMETEHPNGTLSFAPVVGGGA